MHLAALTCRSFYSILRSAVSPQRLVSQAASFGYAAIALADVNAMHGAAEFCKAAEKENIRCVIGAEILTDTQIATLLAEDRRGYHNLCKIISARNLDEKFDLLEQLKRNSAGLICICSQHLLLRELKKIFRRDCLFAGCRDAGEAERVKADGLNPIPHIVFNVVEDDDAAVAVLLGKIRRLSAAGPGSQDNAGLNKLISEEQLRKQFRTCPQAIANSEQIANRCCFKLLDGRYFLPKVRLPHGTDAHRELARLCHIGLARKYKPASREAVKRLEYELGTIARNNFSDYFLVVNEIVSFAKRQNIPVEIRGSAAGSLVAYTLGFTRVCPIENKLYFERFMNPGRSDCPDIDIDLCWRRRDDVIRFCYENWGHDYVAMIANINCYRRRSAIRDAARAMGVEPGRINALVNNRNPDPNAAIYKLAQKIIGIPRHIGLHCGGIVITPKPVAELAPLQWAAKGVVVAQYDKDAAEDLGLVKIDLLGNRALSTVNEAVNFVRKTNALDIDAIDPNDSKTAEMMSRGDSLGVFQCESPGMRQLLRGLNVRSRKDVAIALSLIRPGPASGGMKTEFIERYVHGRPFKYIHPRMADVLGDTCGVMLYQEDVMRIAVEVAGYSVAEADKFRSEVSKKVSTERLQKQYEDFVYGKAGERGIDRDTAEAVWEQILKFAAYSYCKAHATVYANIAWQTAYLKANYPREFYCSIFNNHQGMYPLRIYVWDAMRHGLKILPPHVSFSGVEWAIEGRAIRAGLNIISNLSRSAMRSIVEQRKARPFAGLDDLRRRINFRKPELQSIIRAGGCDGLGRTRPLMLNQLNHALINPGQLFLFEVDALAPPREYDRIEKLKAEMAVTGIPLTMHPAVLLNTKYTPASQLHKFVNRQVTVAGFIAAARTARTSDNRVMGFVTLEDHSGLVEVTFFADRLGLYRDICSSAGPVQVSGKVTEHLRTITVEARRAGGGQTRDATAA